MIKCGQRANRDGSYYNRCRREGLWLLEDRVSTETPVTHNRVYCNVHRSGMDRRRWTSYAFRALTDTDKVILNAAQARDDAEARERAAAQAAEARKRNAERKAQAWDILDDPASFISKEHDAYWDRTDKRWAYSAGRNPNGGVFNSIQFDLANDEGYPYHIRLHSTGTITPNEAIALSDALRDAAAKAALLNERMEH